MFCRIIEQRLSIRCNMTFYYCVATQRSDDTTETFLVVSDLRHKFELEFFQNLNSKQPFFKYEMLNSPFSSSSRLSLVRIETSEEYRANRGWKQSTIDLDVTKTDLD